MGEKILFWKAYIKYILIVDFEQAKVCRVHIEKTSTSEGKIRYIICYVVVYWYLLTNSIWTYTFITLRVNQWEIFAKCFTSVLNYGSLNDSFSWLINSLSV